MLRVSYISPDERRVRAEASKQRQRQIIQIVQRTVPVAKLALHRIFALSTLGVKKRNVPRKVKRELQQLQKELVPSKATKQPISSTILQSVKTPSLDPVLQPPRRKRHTSPELSKKNEQGLYL